MSALPVSKAMPTDEALVSEVIARVARERGIVLTPEDPLITAVLLNNAILEHYLERAAAPIRDAIAKAVKKAEKDLSAQTQAQVSYIEQTMFQDREHFVAEQKAMIDAFDKRLLAHEAALKNLFTQGINKAGEELGKEIEKTARHWGEEKKGLTLFAGATAGSLLFFICTVGLIVLLR